jgi:ankyrin repeat protein
VKNPDILIRLIHPIGLIVRPVFEMAMNREDQQLLVALIDDNAEIVTTILELTNSVNVQISLQSIEIPSLLSHDPPLISIAIYLNAMNCIASLLIHHSNLSITDSLGRAPIHFASAFGQLAVLDLLAHAGANLSATDSKSRTILHYAAQFGHRHIIQWITAQRLGLPITDTQGFTPLHFAAESGEAAIVTQLLEIDPSQPASATGWTPILFAAKNDRLEAFRVLLSHGADIRLANDVFC